MDTAFVEAVRRTATKNAKDAIAECVRTAKVTKQTEIDDLSGRLKLVDDCMERLEQNKKQLFGLEEFAKKSLATKKNELHREKARLTKIHLYGNLPCMSFQPLRWRTDEGWPKIMLFSLDAPTAFFRVRGTKNSWNHSIDWDNDMAPSLPIVVERCYRDVFPLLTERAKKEKKTAVLSATLNGIIPQETREKIAEAKKNFEQLFVAAEVKKWNLEYKTVPTPRPRNYDPLVLGWDGTNLWIIDHFDLTPTERYIKDEFSV